MIVKKMYFDEPAPAYAPTKEPVGTALLLAMALIVSPLGYLTIKPLGQAATTAAQALF
jgi:NADH-quinone oxidoreductase subunit N